VNALQLHEGQLVKWTPHDSTGRGKTVFGIVLDAPGNDTALFRSPGQPALVVPVHEIEEIPATDDLSALLSLVRQLKETAIDNDDYEAAGDLRDIEKAVVTHQNARS
jgi:hypothetical protein